MHDPRQDDDLDDHMNWYFANAGFALGMGEGRPPFLPPMPPLVPLLGHDRARAHAEARALIDEMNDAIAVEPFDISFLHEEEEDDGPCLDFLKG